MGAAWQGPGLPSYVSLAMRMPKRFCSAEHVPEEVLPEELEPIEDGWVKFSDY